MAIGLLVDKATVNTTTGNLVRQLNGVIAAIDAVKTYFDATTDQALIDMGFTSGEVAVIKSAFADLAQLSTIYKGSTNLTTAKDFRVFAKQLTGLGV